MAGLCGLVSSGRSGPSEASGLSGFTDTDKEGSSDSGLPDTKGASGFPLATGLSGFPDAEVPTGPSDLPGTANISGLSGFPNSLDSSESFLLPDGKLCPGIIGLLDVPGRSAGPTDVPDGWYSSGESGLSGPGISSVMSSWSIIDVPEEMGLPFGD